jgi:hypothetical protein
MSRAEPRGALWLTGGILATILGAAVSELSDDIVVGAVIAVAFCVFFGLTIEKMVSPLTRGFRGTTSPLPEEPVEQVHTSDQTR